MAETLVLLSKKGGAPKMSVNIGRAQIGTYEVKLWDDAKSDWEMVGKGVNFDEIDDEFSLGPLAKLEDRFLRWDLIMTAPAVGEQYRATVTIAQGGDTVPGGRYVYEGDIKLNPKIILDMVKVVVR